MHYSTYIISIWRFTKNGSYSTKQGTVPKLEKMPFEVVLRLDSQLPNGFYICWFGRIIFNITSEGSLSKPFQNVDLW